MRTIHLLCLFFSLLSFPLSSQIYQTDIKDKRIKTLQVKSSAPEMLIPAIPLDQSEQIIISFDVLHEGFNFYGYSIIHCDADWQQSALSPIEYIDGFQGLTIEDFSNSKATTTLYTNYQLTIPNKDIQLKVSGNYVVRVYDENDPSQTILTACFSVYEPQVSLVSTISGNTDIDTNQAHQQLSFTINHANFPILYPHTDLKIIIQQNNRRDNMVQAIQPRNIMNGLLEYAHIRELIFEAGNEYRRMEFLSNTYNGMHVNAISFHNPYYHVELMPDIVRRNKTYQYDQDQNGRSLINCSECNDPDTEADYYIVHFTLDADRLPNGQVYLLSDLYNNVLDEKSRMGYNTQTRQYEKSLQVKQGHHNYQYIFIPDGQTTGTAFPIEGNYSQAENEYSIYVYFRPMSGRFDRLIGYSTIRHAMIVF